MDDPSTGFTLLDFLKLVGSLGFFIYGMKVMSEGIQKIAGKKMRQILGAITTNRLSGVLTGFSITSLIQSSSAATVMVVSFVNAGLLNLRQSIGVIMGANIGTTVTAWLVSIFGFSKLDISDYSLPIIAIGFPLMFIRNGRVKATAEFLIGFALLFLGLSALKDSIPKLDGDSLQFLSSYTDLGILTTLLFVLVGTILTIVLQSSSAAMTLTLGLLFQNIITYEMAAALVLGENIGTTITANLAALIANVHAKRAARAHFIFNTFGVLWMIIALPWFTDFIQYLWNALSSGYPGVFEKGNNQLQLSLFHTVFNIINTSLLIWFVPFIAKLVTYMVPTKNEEDEQFHLDFIGGGILATPELSLVEARKEVTKFGRITQKMHGFVEELMSSKDEKKVKQLIERIEKYEIITDRIEEEVIQYLLKVSEGGLTAATSARVRSMLSIVGDLEDIGDIYFQMSRNYAAKRDAKAWFTPEQRNHLKELMTKVEAAFEVTVDNLQMDVGEISLETPEKIEVEINTIRDQMRSQHLESIARRDYNIRSGMIYTDFYSSIEKVGDLLFSINSAASGQI
ncbi:MAG: Na/Pi cotransporter family protein [Salibacteraceae bacterium]